MNTQLHNFFHVIRRISALLLLACATSLCLQRVPAFRKNFSSISLTAAAAVVGQLSGYCDQLLRFAAAVHRKYELWPTSRFISSSYIVASSWLYRNLCI